MNEIIESDLIPEIKEVHTEIPINSGSILIDDYTSRFSSAVWYEAIQKKEVLLAGVGGIGSYVGFLLSRMHPAKLYLMDPDIVEEVNMSGQLYSREDINKSKVNALSQMVMNYSNYYSTIALQDRFDGNSGCKDIMICGFDNMEARRTFFQSWRNHVEAYTTKEQRAACLFIDGRLAAEELQILCIRGDDDYNIERYSKEFLFKDSEAETTICSYKQTTFMANMIGSIIVNLFVNFVANECNPLIERDLPFYTTYSAETMFYKTES